MPHAPPLAAIAGPTALAAGVLMVVAEVVMWPFTPAQHQATAADPVFQAGGGIYFVAFCLLLVALTAAYVWEAGAAGRFGVVGFVAALVGTFALGGDLWFETFAVPWLADRSPVSLETTPTTLLGIGALFSYASFALGWALFGLASLRARVFPAPFGAVLGLATAALGAWMIRATTAAVEVQRPASGMRRPPSAAPGRR
jgi:hypothetical protein